MSRALRLLVLLAILAIPALVSTPVLASTGGAVCIADPQAGPPGTVFTITCSGFGANKIINTYVVEPDGRAVSGALVSGFLSNLGADGSILSDKNGTAVFTWQSAGGGAAGFAVQIGTWTWVAHELSLGGQIAAAGQVSLGITAQPVTISGAALSVDPTSGTAFNFTGTGFAPLEMVNVWLTVPPACSGRLNVEGASAVEPSIQGFFEGFDGPSVVRADKFGGIVFSIVFRPEACRGVYSLSARAPGDETTSVVGFEVTGNAVGNNASLTATPAVVNSIAPFLTLLGSGFAPTTTVSCWTTRPDGRAFGVGEANVDKSGNFNLLIHASGYDSFWPFASEEPGIWYATCGTPNGATTAVTSFMVTSLTNDP